MKLSTALLALAAAPAAARGAGLRDPDPAARDPELFLLDELALGEGQAFLCDNKWHGCDGCLAQTADGAKPTCTNEDHAACWAKEGFSFYCAGRNDPKSKVMDAARGCAALPGDCACGGISETGVACLDEAMAMYPDHPYFKNGCPAILCAEAKKGACALVARDPAYEGEPWSRLDCDSSGFVADLAEE